MALRLSFFYAAIFLGIGVMMPFWPVWLKSRGMGAAEIGMLLAAGMWVRAFTNPLLAQLADRQGRPDRMLVMLGWGALAVNLLYFPAHDFWTLMAVGVPATMLFTALLPLGDAVTMLKVRDGVLDYGRVRLWGSLTFIVAATGGGYVLEGRSPDAILWLIIATLALVVAACHLVPRADTPGARSFSAPLAALVRDRRLPLFMVAASLVQASHAVYYGFATLHWQAAGIADPVIGALWAEGVICEIALFAVSGRLVARFGPVALLASGALAGVLRWTVLGTTAALPALIAVQGMHAFTFGAAHVAAMHYIARAMPAEFAATAQSVYSSFAVGTAMAVTMLVSGALYDALGGGAFYAMAVLSVAGGALVPVLARGGAKA